MSYFIISFFLCYIQDFYVFTFSFSHFAFFILFLLYFPLCALSFRVIYFNKTEHDVFFFHLSKHLCFVLSSSCCPSVYFSVCPLFLSLIISPSDTIKQKKQGTFDNIKPVIKIQLNIHVYLHTGMQPAHFVHRNVLQTHRMYKRQHHDYSVYMWLAAVVRCINGEKKN